MSENKPTDLLDQRMAMAAEQLQQNQRTPTEVEQVQNLTQRILTELPEEQPHAARQQAAAFDLDLGARILQWFQEKLWRGAAVAMIPAILGFGIGMLQTSQTEPEFGEYADIVLAQESLFAMGTGLDTGLSDE